MKIRFIKLGRNGQWEKSCIEDEQSIRLTITAYDNVGNVIAVTDARGNATYTRYDAANRPVAVVQPEVPLADGTFAYPSRPARRVRRRWRIDDRHLQRRHIGAGV